MNGLDRCALLLTSVLLFAGCGTSGSPADEALGRRTAALVAPPRISPDFGLDQEAVRDFNTHANLLSIAASNDAGYLLAYQGVSSYDPEDWSRRFRRNKVTAPPFDSNAPALTLVRWDPANGSVNQLANLPNLGSGAQLNRALVLGVGSGWLVVSQVLGYQDSLSLTYYVVSVSPNGSVSAPTAVVPSQCHTGGLAGFARSTTTALLTDTCGNGVLLNLSGQVIKTMVVANPAPFLVPSCVPPVHLIGGQVAFNGIDYFATYSCLDRPKTVIGFSVSPAGDLGPYLTVAEDINYSKEVKSLSLSGSGTGDLLAVIAQQQSVGYNTAAVYVRISESADHVFSIGPAVALPGESTITDGKPSDRSATAVTLGSDFAIVRERSNGDFDLVRLGLSGAPDTTQPLLGALPNAPVALVSSVDPFAGGTKFMLAAGARGVRFNSSNQALDDPPTALVSYPRSQFAPSLAFDGQTFLAAWTEAVKILPGYSAKTPQIFGHRLSVSGTLLGSASFGITSATGLGRTSRVAATPGLFSSAWGGLDDALLSTATISSSDPPVVMPKGKPTPLPNEFTIATDGAHAVVAWSSASAIMLAQLPGTSGWGTPLTVAPNSDPWASAPALAFNAGQYAVLWTVQGTTGERILYGARVNASPLALLDIQPKELLRFGSYEISSNQWPPFSVPSDMGVTVIAVGDQFVVAWTGYDLGSLKLRIARLSSTLQLLDTGGIPIAERPYSSMEEGTPPIALDWDGTNIWAIWRDIGDSRPYASLRGRRFSDALVPVDSEPFLISTDLDEFSQVTLVHGAGDSSLVGYTRYLATDGSFRVRGRFLSSTVFADGVACNDASQCQNDACVAGHCATATGGAGGAGTGGASAGMGGASAGMGGTIGIGGNVGTTGGTIGLGGTIEAGGVSGMNASIAGNGGTGVFAGNGGLAGTAGISGTAGVGGGFAHGGFAGEGAGSGSAGGDGQNVAGAIDSSGGSAGQTNDAGVGGELVPNTAGSGTSGGRAGTGGQAPEPDSCSCRVPGRQSGGNQLPVLAGVLVALGTALARRRRASLAWRTQ